MTAPRYFLVTNDASRAAREIWCHPGNLPPSVAIADSLDLMMHVPVGAQVRCYWYGAPAELEPWENCWWSRRVRGGFDWISAEDWARIEAWAWERRHRPDTLLLDSVDIGPWPGGEGAAGAGSAAPAPLPPPTPAGERAAKWT